MNFGLLNHGFRLTASWILKEMLKVSTLSFNTGRCISEQWLSDPLQNSRCRTSHLKPILCSLLQVLEVTDFCSTNSRLQMSAQVSMWGIYMRGTGRPCCWSACAVHCSGNTLFKNCPTARRRCGGSPSCTNRKWIQSADPRLATALEEGCVGNRGKQRQSDVVEESRVPEVCLHGNSRWTLWTFSFFVRGTNLGNHALKGLW